LTAGSGAFGSGNNNAACILGDFTLATLGIDTIVARRPDGLTMYGNVATCTASGVGTPYVNTITFPNSFAFANSIMFTLANAYGPTPPGSMTIASYPISTTQIGIALNGPAGSSYGITYLAFGY